MAYIPTNKGKTYVPSKTVTEDPSITAGVTKPTNTYNGKTDKDYMAYLQNGGTSNYDKWSAGMGMGGDSYTQDAIGQPATGVEPYPERQYYQPTGYSFSDMAWGGRPYGKPKEQQYESTFGGISAVNPQSDMDVQGYIDQSYNAVLNRLQPQFEQNRDAFDQAMINRGIPIGSEAYNETLRQMSQNENDALTQAAYQAMGFGADLQNQNFQQDATRSSLANAMLQSKWGNQLGWGQVGLGYDTLNQRATEFGQNMDYNWANLDERGRQFDQGMDFGYFNADRDDMRWLTEFDRLSTNDQINNNRWADQMAQWYLNPYQAPQVNVGPMNTNYLGQSYAYNNQMNRTNNWWDALNQWGIDNGYWGN